MLNLNVGILGHVDSGKTSLAKVLSEVASTAAFDKNPQSKERGITLDLGFSSFIIPKPEHLRDELPEDCIQFTLVDCPGHASLIKTIIGGAQIIDMMLLVVDVTKGIQTQTAECLVIGELTCKKLIVVVNKIDQIFGDKPKIIDKMTKKLKTVLATTVFKDSPLVCIAANPADAEPIGIDHLTAAMADIAFIPKRDKDAAFLFSVDHCFGIKGQGTVMTGTILQGMVRINDIVQIPLLNQTKKIKSMQMFRKPIQEAHQGDRVGICVTQFDAKLLERGIVCTPDFATFSQVALIRADRIKYFKLPIKTKSKFHITLGHETVMATITCFSTSVAFDKQFNFDLEYLYCDEFEELTADNPKTYYILLDFEKPVLTVPNCLVIGSKLDMDVHGSNCRIAFSGNLLETSKDKDYKMTFLPKLKVFKTKRKVGAIDRYVNETELIVKNLFKKDANIQQFLGLNVTLSTGELGVIESQFGQSGKIKVARLNLKDSTKEVLKSFGKKRQKEVNNTEHFETIQVILEFKRYVYDVHKKIIQ